MGIHGNTDGRSVVSSYPAAGFQNDVAKLLQRFVATKSIRFEEFLKVWKASNFTFIYLGRNGLREKRDLLEESFRILIKYIMPPYNLQVRVGGIYTLYSIYHTQPLKQKVKIRIPLSCWPNFCALEKEILEHQHLDAAYIIRKLNSDRAFHLTAYPSMLSVDEAFVMNGMQSDILEQIVSSSTVYNDPNPLNQLLEDDTLGQLDAVHEKYHQLKCSYNALQNGKCDTPASSLNLIKPDIAKSIVDIISPPEKAVQFASSSQYAENSMPRDLESGERAVKLKTLKESALSSDVVELKKLQPGHLHKEVTAVNSEISSLSQHPAEATPNSPDCENGEKLIEHKRLEESPMVPPVMGLKKRGRPRTKKVSVKQEKISETGLVVRKRGRPNSSAPSTSLPKSWQAGNEQENDPDEPVRKSTRRKRTAPTAFISNKTEDN